MRGAIVEKGAWKPKLSGPIAKEWTFATARG
jgi:hypothetical protein